MIRTQCHRIVDTEQQNIWYAGNFLYSVVNVNVLYWIPTYIIAIEW